MISSLSSRRDKVGAAEHSLPTVQKFDDDEGKNGQQEEEEEEAVVKQDGHGEIVREKGLSFATILFDFFKGLFNSSVLLFPWAFNNARPWYGLVLLFSIALLSVYSMSKLVKCAQYHYTRLNISFLNFGNVAEETFKVSFRWAQNHGRLAKNIVNITTIVHQFSVCSLYYLFIATSLGRNLEDADTLNKWWFLVIFIPLVVLNSVMNMRILSILCLIGNGLMLTSLALILYVLIDKVHDDPAKAVKDIGLDVNLEGIFITCGTIMVACLAQSLVLPLENKIKKPQQMLGPFGILSLGTASSTVIYASVGFFGYLAYGEGLTGSVMNCLKHYLAPGIWLTLGLSIFTSFMLQMFVIVDVLWPQINQWMKHFSPRMKICGRLLFRALLVFTCCSIGYSLGNPRIIIPLIGVTTGNLLAFVYPAIIDLFTFVPLLLNQCRVRDAYVRLTYDILLACFGLVILVGGVTENILAIVEGETGAQGCNITTTAES